MHRRKFLGMAGLSLVAPATLWGEPMTTSKETTEIEKLEKTKDEWRELIERDRYRILFEEGTERAFTSPLNDEKRAGTFICAACHLPLFDASAKFDSGTGWPSFYQAIEGRMGTSRDFKLIYPRKEYHCIRCGGHQGHIFNDGPRPTGSGGATTASRFSSFPRAKSFPPLRS